MAAAVNSERTEVEVAQDSQPSIYLVALSLVALSVGALWLSVRSVAFISFL